MILRLKAIPFLKEDIMQNLNMLSEIGFEFFKIPQKSARPENYLKITLNDNFP